ncbi:MAG: elongation factor Ts [Clostridia bacterium]|nr:elongation factor Ts [Clostridia bacterium]
MAFTAKDVAALREMSGAGMMDCKKALVECDGNMEKAMDYLREKSLAASAKKASRIAAEGLVASYITEDGQTGVMIEMNCETDFVAKNDAFKGLVLDMAKHVAKAQPATVEEMMEQAYVGDTSKTIATVITEAVAKIGEKITIRRFVTYNAANGFVDAYIHMNGSTGVLVEVENMEYNADNKAVLHDIAMHAAAAKPSYIRREEVDSSELEKEKEILRAQALNEGKPEKIVEKMVEGRINKFYEEICLNEQAFVKDTSMKIEQYLTGAAAGAKLVRFTLYIMGEGLQKREDNFAEEVMSQVK